MTRPQYIAPVQDFCESKNHQAQLVSVKPFFPTIHMPRPWVRSGETALRWRSQFAPEPANRLSGFHRIDKLDHALMNVIASGAFECSDVKA